MQRKINVKINILNFIKIIRPCKIALGTLYKENIENRNTKRFILKKNFYCIKQLMCENKDL